MYSPIVDHLSLAVRSIRRHFSVQYGRFECLNMHINIDEIVFDTNTHSTAGMGGTEKYGWSNNLSLWKQHCKWSRLHRNASEAPFSLPFCCCCFISLWCNGVVCGSGVQLCCRRMVNGASATTRAVADVIEYNLYFVEIVRQNDGVTAAGFFLLYFRSYFRVVIEFNVHRVRQNRMINNMRRGSLSYAHS